MNIAEILKNAPKGTKLYSPIFGEVELSEVDSIFINIKHDVFIAKFYSDGKYTKNGECMLFPSRENRDWSTFTLNKFDVSSLKPFDRVLVRDVDSDYWKAGIYSHYNGNCAEYSYVCVGNIYRQCVPYNDDTKHLLGTTKDCPEYYKTW